MRRALTAAAAVLMLAGCGGASHPDPLGVAAGNAFVRMFDPTRSKSAFALASDFQLWAAGKLANSDLAGAPPGSALSAPERHAAAAVVLHYAEELVGRGQLPATLPNGQDVLTYLRSQGVN